MDVVPWMALAVHQDYKPGNVGAQSNYHNLILDLNDSDKIKKISQNFISNQLDLRKKSVLLLFGSC